MLSSITAYEHKKAWMLEQEVGEIIGVEGRTVQNYKAGQIPTNPETIRKLAEIAVRRGYLNKAWVQWFLKEAYYPTIETLVSQLFEGSIDQVPLRSLRHNLPAPAFSQFVERTQPYSEIVEGLRQRSAVVVVVGPGGMGKTSLVHEIATRCVQQLPDLPQFDAVVWISDKDDPGSTTLARILDELAYTLDYPGYLRLPPNEKQRKVEDILRKRHVLLIIDNIETIEDPLLPGWLVRFPEPGKVLVTSRELSPTLRNSSWVVELRGMTHNEALMLVQQRLHLLKLTKLPQDDIAPLIAATGGSPKALEMSLGLIKYEKHLPQDILGNLATIHQGLFDNLFSQAWASLDHDARCIFLAMVLFRGSASGAALAETANIQGLAFDRALERLIDLALIDTTHTNEERALPRYTLHPLVRVFAHTCLTEYPLFEQQARERWAAWYVAYTSNIGYAWDNPELLHRLDDEHETVFAVLCWTAQEERHQDTIHLARETEYYYYLRALWDKKLALHLMYADAARALDDRNEEMQALSLHIQLLSRQGKIAEASHYLPRLHRLAESIPPDNESFFFYHHALALYHLATSNIQAAREAWQYILDNSRNLPAHMQTGTRQWLATCLSMQGLSTEAYNQYYEALQEAQAQNFERYAHIIQLKMARITLEQGNTQEIETVVGAIYERIREGNDHELLAHTQYIRAHLYRLRGAYQTAREALYEAMDRFDRMGLTIETATARAELEALAEKVC
jgi:hypothetical protein